MQYEESTTEVSSTGSESTEAGSPYQLGGGDWGRLLRGGDS